jgi:hypothetical protein
MAKSAIDWSLQSGFLTDFPVSHRAAPDCNITIKFQLGHSWKVHADLIKDVLRKGGEQPVKRNLGGLAFHAGKLKFKSS